MLRHVPEPTGAGRQELVLHIAGRIGKVVQQRGLGERAMENLWLITQGQGDPLDDQTGRSITCRIAVGPFAGQELFTRPTAPAREP